MRRLRLFVAGLLAAGALYACQPPCPPANCAVVFGWPVLNGRSGPYDIVDTTGYYIGDWWYQCKARIIALKVDGSPNIASHKVVNVYMIWPPDDPLAGRGHYTFNDPRWNDGAISRDNWVNDYINPILQG